MERGQARIDRGTSRERSVELLAARGQRPQRYWNWYGLVAVVVVVGTPFPQLPFVQLQLAWPQPQAQPPVMASSWPASMLSNGDLAALVHRGEHVGQAHQHLTDLVAGLLTEATAAGQVRDDVAPSELAVYCIHAITAAASLPSKAAVLRLVQVTRYVYDASWLGDVVPGIGFVATIDAIGADLEPLYATRVPWGAMVFVRLRAPEMLEMHEHGAMSDHDMHAM
jgi:hypothetical protein